LSNALHAGEIGFGADSHRWYRCVLLVRTAKPVKSGDHQY
jgi:hypothetical protein